jgi:hypothetical protein
VGDGITARGRLALAALLLAAAAGPAAAQEATDDGWNAPAAVRLIERAQERRLAAYEAAGLQDYQADARGYVYFYIDFTETDERHLVRTDQLALDVFWRAPGVTRQVITGRRHRETLPTNIRYYTDRLVAVLDNFGDDIVIADGDNVRNVPHPVAPGSLERYDVRLADRVTLRLPGAPEPVRVREVRVRPKDPSRPAFVGAVFLDEDRGDIVRMEFSFTPAAYVDPEVDRIRISLEHALWEGRYWLPHEQRMEIRRELPQLDLPAGTVILARMRMSNYRINRGLPAALFIGPPVVARPQEEQRAFTFEEELHAELRAEGLVPTRDPAALRERAERLAREHAASGLPRTRIRLPAASRVLRYNRAEGVAVGAGISLSPAEMLSLRGEGGWATGPAHPTGRLEARWPGTLGSVTARLRLNDPVDMGFRPVISGAMNTVTAAIAGRDHLDPFYASGAAVELGRRLDATWEMGAEAALERHRPAALTTTYALAGTLDRPLPYAARADVFALGVSLTGGTDPEQGAWWTAGLRPTVTGWRSDAPEAAGAAGWSGGLLIEAARGYRWAPGAADLRLRAAGGVLAGSPLPQEHFRVGGRGTVPGHPFRERVGDRMAVLDLEGSRDLAWPWLRARGLAAAGWAGGGHPADDWPLAEDPEGSRAAAASIGAGLGVFYDILRVDLHRGIGPGGGWELVVEARPGFWRFL